MDRENSIAVSEGQKINIKIRYKSGVFFAIFTTVLTFKTITDTTKVTKLQVIFLLEV